MRPVHDSLIAVASALNGGFTSAIHRIRCVIEQVDPHLREFARIAAHVTTFAREILDDMNVLELVIKNAPRALLICSCTSISAVSARSCLALERTASTNRIRRVRRALRRAT
jgi:phage-related minor tail protein